MLRNFRIAAGVVALLSAPAYSQDTTAAPAQTPEISVPATEVAVPTAIAEVIAICAPVIAEEYAGKTDRWNACINATQAYVNYVLGPPVQAENLAQTAADLVFELSKLYQDGEVCLENPTELPDAIAVALRFEMDDQQRALITSIADAMKACQAVETGAIPPVPAPASSGV
jgi:hypothetical protein